MPEVLVKTGNYEIKLYVSYSISQNIVANTSTITCGMRVQTKGSGWDIGPWTDSNGSYVGTTSNTFNGSIPNFAGSRTLTSNQTFTVNHNSDGTGSATIYWKWGVNSSWGGFVKPSGSFTISLPTIPRASVLDSVTCSTSYLNGTFTYKYTPKNASFYNRLRVSIPNVVVLQTVNLGQKSTSQQTGTYTLSSSLLQTVYNRYPNQATSYIGLVIETYSDSGYSSKIGESSEIKLNLTFPESVVPTVGGVSITEGSEFGDHFGVFIQNKSKLNVGITAAGVYGSTISKYETYIESVLYSGSSFTSNVITTSGQIGVRTVVTDSRGRTATVTNNVNIVQYSLPTISIFSGVRCDEQGTPDDDGERVNLEINFSISSINNLNDKSYSIEYKLSSESQWTSLTSGSVYSYASNFVTNAVFSVDYSYDVKITVRDYFASVTAEISLPTSFNIFDVNESGKGIEFGAASQEDCFGVSMNAKFRKDVEFANGIIQEDRQTPTLLNSWVNYGAAYESASYWKDSCGVVRLSGLIKGGATTAETVIFTLPEGYRPQNSEKFFAVSLNAICVIDVYATGNVAIKTGANSGWLSLSGIAFKAKTS